MIAVLQRVASAAVTVAGQRVAGIDSGLLVLLCVEVEDTDQDSRYFARKIARMRIFEDVEGRMNRSVADTGGAVLAVSQFTLAADWRRGNRPSFSGAASQETGKRLFEQFRSDLAAEGVPVECGVYGAKMRIELVNDGPVTVVMRSRDT